MNRKLLLLVTVFVVSGCSVLSFDHYANDMIDRYYGRDSQEPVYIDEDTQALLEDRFIIWLNDDEVDQALVINDRN